MDTLPPLEKDIRPCQKQSLKPSGFISFRCNKTATPWSFVYVFLVAKKAKVPLAQAGLAHQTANVQGVDELAEVVAAMVLKEDTAQV